MLRVSSVYYVTPWLAGMSTALQDQTRMVLRPLVVFAISASCRCVEAAFRRRSPASADLVPGY